MAVTWPIELDPDEELWLPVNWAPVWAAGAAETIQTSLFELSSQAIMDGVTIIEQEHSATASNLKVTGGTVGADYPILLTITTLDTNGKTRKRQRTCLLECRAK